MFGLVALTVFTFDGLSQSCTLRCALFTLAGCIFLWGGWFPDKKVL